MREQENKKIVSRFVSEAQSRGNMGAVDEFLAESFIDHSALPGFLPTPVGVKQLFGALRTAFPDLQAIIHDQIAEGDRVVTRKTLSGTHQGTFMGIPPTGRKVKINVIDILRIVDGKITDHWNVIDRLGLMQQLGVIQAHA